MADREYTLSQKQAINSSGHNILVSASAGSGKTSVLVERVIQKIINGEDVDRLLVVTFTEAAASEMKERIRAAIVKKINEVSDIELQNHFSMQLNKLNNANISTLHAFCMSIIRNYYYIIDLDPTFRIMDPTESELLKESVWADLREELYERDGDGKFALLTRNFSSDRSDEGLQDLILELFEFSNANPDPQAWLQQIAKNYEVPSNNVMDMEFIQQLLAEVKTKLMRIYRKDLDLTERAINGGEPLKKAAEKFQNEVDDLKSIIDSLNGSWDELQQAVSKMKFAQLPRGKKEEVQEFNAYAKSIRNDFKDEFNTIADNYFKLSSEQMIAVFKDAHDLMMKLIEVQNQFAERFLQEKLTRRSLDFSDLEHFALQIVLDDSEEGQAIRRDFQQKFNEVIVDEYQDINPLQETILTSVASSDPGNMFMVGDVKQSIYAFRMADPSLFISKNNQFKDEEQADERIILAENFRSMRNVDDFTNLIFNQVMDTEVGEIEYDDDAQLQFGAKYYPDEVQNNTEVMIYDDSQTDIDDKEATPIISNKNDGQLQMIAQRIQKLFADHTQIYDKKEQKMRDLEYSDIALLHSTGSNNLEIVDTFKKYGIPIQVNNAQDYFQTTEVSIMMALLKIIDNPYQDIPLAAVLRSPMVGLKENELAFLRIGKKNGHYFEALLYFLNEAKLDSNNEFQMQLKTKITHFLEQLDRFSKLARQSTLVDLLWAIYDETGYLDYVGGMPDGPQRQNNLHALYDRAKGYEESSFKGLFQFVRFVEKMRDKNKDLAENPVVTDVKAVKLMTIHGSKGLEFPIVFLIDAEHGFNTMDEKGRYVLDRDAGMGITLKDFIHRLEIDTVQKNWIISIKKQKALAEKLRVLYVALTRAEQKLIITGAVNSADDTLNKWAEAVDTDETLIPAEARSKVSNFLDWIGMAIMRVPSVVEKYADYNTRKLQGTLIPDVELKIINSNELMDQQGLTALKSAQIPELQQLNASDDIAEVDKLKQIMNFKYHDEAATTTTAYQSVSEIKRVFDDPDKFELNFSEVDADQHIKPQNRFVTESLMAPRFMNEATKPKAAEIGTATHLILQQLDLNQPINETIIKDKIGELVMNRVLDEQVANRIRISTILDFFDSDLGQLMINHPENVHREEAFSLLLPAKGLFPKVKGDDDVLIHGIIDAYFEMEDRVILLDYKTDFVLPGSVEQGIEKVINRYQGQVNLYAQALESILKRPVNEKYLYLLSIGRLVEIQ
ncbi:helicase-exonuclease AddAB subunit AddA [Pediococcus pentosaceus]|uniref:helicase-exonuclease AddAB subunit AddA n=1 Tax=Pediococcus pentosaceus TaxID=1255 RepID=UPI0006D8984B|nr:helicase-exonuclease AddAB subunit AddA [Pediococcus pentosaceus]ANI97165.1 helicase-exonuclease AddAB subunit AddA [Pediococcus pentosaceus]KQB80128.1 ATP-dependent helicase [Pediococcus pentosaceus]MBF7112917.1 helicase-exonuclease AddAB subunit AddA [Pediococcus pentosaceus]MBY4581906.1 helicase-exonuclease AddAB subunit AddA [Pediococcus pentosaceus]MDY8106549.1 helicase-exonuclease AddAB subunit AddA [Pediococcus pentosaceus]